MISVEVREFLRDYIWFGWWYCRTMHRNGKVTGEWVVTRSRYVKLTRWRIRQRPKGHISIFYGGDGGHGSGSGI